MENTKIDYANLPLEEAKKEFASCFDKDGEVKDPKKHQALLKNKKLFAWLFSRKKLEQNASQDSDLFFKASAETFLNKAFPPSWYWKMPDYYYPGLYSDNIQGKGTMPSFASKGNTGRILSTISRNESVLNDCGWEREKYDIPDFFNRDFPNLKISFKKDLDIVSVVRINPETKESLKSVDIPFSLICGVFLMCREYEFKKPWQLRSHDYKERYPDYFEDLHGIVRNPETHEIINYGDWKPDEE